MIATQTTVYDATSVDLDDYRGQMGVQFNKNNAPICPLIRFANDNMGNQLSMCTNLGGSGVNYITLTSDHTSITNNHPSIGGGEWFNFGKKKTKVPDVTSANIIKHVSIQIDNIFPSSSRGDNVINNLSTWVHACQGQCTSFGVIVMNMPWEISKTSSYRPEVLNAMLLIENTRLYNAGYLYGSMQQSSFVFVNVTANTYYRELKTKILFTDFSKCVSIVEIKKKSLQSNKPHVLEFVRTLIGDVKEIEVDLRSGNEMYETMRRLFLQATQLWDMEPNKNLPFLGKLSVFKIKSDLLRKERQETESNAVLSDGFFSRFGNFFSRNDDKEIDSYNPPVSYYNEEEQDEFEDQPYPDVTSPSSNKYRSNLRSTTNKSLRPNKTNIKNRFSNVDNNLRGILQTGQDVVQEKKLFGFLGGRKSIKKRKRSQRKTKQQRKQKQAIHQNNK